MQTLMTLRELIGIARYDLHDHTQTFSNFVKLRLSTI